MNSDSLFKFRAVSASGEQSQGQLRAADASAVARELTRQGLTPLSIEPAVQTAAPARKRGQVGRREMCLVLQELATLLQAGISLAEALPSLAHAYARQSAGPMLAAANLAVRGGARLSEAMQQPGIAWPNYVVALVKAGEASGELARALADAAAQLEHEQTVAQELRSALIYPSVLVSAGVIAVLTVFIGVVPKFATMLKSSRAEIPALSRWVIETGVFMQQNLFALAMCVALLVLVGAALVSRPGAGERVFEALCRLPGIGNWLRSVDVGRWALVLGALLASRVPFIEAIQLSAGTLRSLTLRRGLLASVAQLQQGRSLSEFLESQAWFPEVRLNLIRVGERSGELPKMLTSLGQMETQASRLLQKRVLALIEPAAILVIGAVIGVVMVAVMMAVTSLNSAAV